MLNLFSSPPPLAPDYKLMLFFGSPRTGSTLLGQILNQHPDILVANEYRFLQKVVREQRDIKSELQKLRSIAWTHYRTGLKKDSYFSDKLSKFQSQWIEFKGARKKNSIRILGDKKAGGNTGIYLEQPTRTENFIKEHKPFLLQIVRHPIEAAKSSAKAFDLEFKHALKDQILRTTEAYRLLQDHPDLRYIIYYDDLIRTPREELEKLAGFLGIPADQDWLSVVVQSVNDSTTKAKAYDPDQIALTKQMIDRYQAQDIFGRYPELA